MVRHALAVARLLVQAKQVASCSDDEAARYCEWARYTVSFVGSSGHEPVAWPRLWAEEAWVGFLCKYVVGAVVKPSAAVGQEAAQNEKERAAKGHEHRPRVKGPAPQRFVWPAVYKKDPRSASALPSIDKRRHK